jgi:hypothetical protein
LATELVETRLSDLAVAVRVAVDAAVVSRRRRPRSYCGWAHFEFTRMNRTPTILHNKIEEGLIVWPFVSICAAPERDAAEV